MPRKLRVFRTPIGFHDAYVAAPSRKAALAAWGAEANLFARGTAEQVSDPKLMLEPLKNAKPKPPPKRDRLDKAEAALDAAREKQAKERSALEKQREALDREL